ncbi:MAG: hypothetical protein M5T52_02735 [Ignavibacteriaceae bacterium]|nr:hypothetical protein [Ignavibacteriaceae bacterium]
MFRLYFLTFEGKEKFKITHHSSSKATFLGEGVGDGPHPHESPKLMTIPLIILAILSAIGGFIGIPEIFSGEHINLFHSWLAPIFKTAEIKLMDFGSHSHSQELLLMLISIIAAVSAILYARFVYLKKPEVADKTASRFKGIYHTLLNKYILDEAYEATIVNPIVKGSEKILWNFTDNKVIDGLINYIAKLIDALSGVIKKIQTGVAQSYALMMVLGILIALFWIILRH